MTKSDIEYLLTEVRKDRALKNKWRVFIVGIMIYQVFRDVPNYPLIILCCMIYIGTILLQLDK